jgi:V/A-type H+-transporting ATPase subunit D
VNGLRGVPPGRAGRAWLLERLHTAERGVGLLDGKLRVLGREQQRYRLRLERTTAEWERSCREAETWLLRAALLGGRRGLRAAAPDDPVQVEVSWTVVMGVRHPGATVLAGGLPDPEAAGPGNTALVLAADAFRAATQAAAAHAVVDAAVRRIDAEVAATRRRLRAVRDRWIPRLTGELQAVELGLAELEQAEGSRLRWAVGRSARLAQEEER